MSKWLPTKKFGKIQNLNLMPSIHICDCRAYLLYHPCTREIAKISNSYNAETYDFLTSILLHRFKNSLNT